MHEEIECPEEAIFIYLHLSLCEAMSDEYSPELINAREKGGRMIGGAPLRP